MDAKTVAGKTVFFILICLFVAVFSTVFGQDNALVGVVIVVLALMMLGKDLSVRPLWNLGGLLVFTLAMGVGAFVSTYFDNAFLGLAINFSFVFLTTFVTMHDLNSPMHFPFLLGYAFMLSVPVPMEDLPVRILALVLGSVFIVALNVAINHNSRRMTSHRGIIAICEEVKACRNGIVDGSEVTPDRLDDLCYGLNRRIYDRLKDRFFTTPNDRTLLDLVISLQIMGNTVCTEVRDARTLGGLSGLMDEVCRHEEGSEDIDAVCSAIDGFLSTHTDAAPAIVSALRTMRDELRHLAQRDGGDGYDGDSVPKAFRMRTVMRENLRTDSVKFTFALRMAILFSVWGFVWQNWDLENAKWLVFTTVALVQPYVEGAWRKSVMRVTGTLVGVAVFVVALMLSDGDTMVLSAILMVANYIYTVLDPKRYDVMMIFITLSALIAASMSTTADDAIFERVMFILLGVALATVANHVMMPYHLRDENIDLAGRYLSISRGQIESLGPLAEGRGDASRDAALVLTATNISAKMGMNVSRDGDPQVERFLMGQNSITAQCRMLTKVLPGSGEECRKRVASLVSSSDWPAQASDGAQDGLDGDDAEIVKTVVNVLSTYSRNHDMVADMLSSRAA